MFTNGGTIIKGRRLELGLKQCVAARKMGFKTIQQLCNIEQGKAAMPMDKIKAASKVLKMSPQALFVVVTEDIMLNLLNKAGLD